MLNDDAQTFFKSSYECLGLISRKKGRAVGIFDLEHDRPVGRLDWLPFLSSRINDDMKPPSFVIDPSVYPEIKRMYHSAPYSGLCNPTGGDAWQNRELFQPLCECYFRVDLRDMSNHQFLVDYIVVAVNTDGCRDASGKRSTTNVYPGFPKGIAIGVSAAETFWVEFLRRLTRAACAACSS